MSPIASQFQILNEYPVTSASPGKCYRCGSDRKPVVSIGISVHMEGVIFFCAACVEEAAALLGMIPADKAEELRQNNRALGQKNKTLIETNEMLRTAFTKQRELDTL